MTEGRGAARVEAKVLMRCGRSRRSAVVLLGGPLEEPNPGEAVLRVLTVCLRAFVRVQAADAHLARWLATRFARVCCLTCAALLRHSKFANLQVP